MFDFLDSDWFNISLQILFLLLMYYDIKKYMQTRKKEYIFNIVTTIGFAIWMLYPYYTSYTGWLDKEKSEILSSCEAKTKEAKKLCVCVDNAIFQHYTHAEYITLDKNSTDFIDFLKETKEDCEDDSWF